MHSLVISIISIALVSILAAAATFFGGDAFTKANTNAQAVSIINSGEQITAAIKIYRAETGEMPGELEVLVEKGYLTSIPGKNRREDEFAHGFEMISSAHAEQVENPWFYDKAYPYLYFKGDVSVHVCSEINKIKNETSIVMDRVDPLLNIQCASNNGSRLYVTFKKEFQDIQISEYNPDLPALGYSGILAAYPDNKEGRCVIGCESRPGFPNYGEPLIAERIMTFKHHGPINGYTGIGEPPFIDPDCIYPDPDADARIATCSGIFVANISKAPVSNVTLSATFKNVLSDSTVKALVIYDTCTNVTLAPGEQCFLIVKPDNLTSGARYYIFAENFYFSTESGQRLMFPGIGEDPSALQMLVRNVY